MQKSRIEAFSDGVFAIIITIMILELKVPQGSMLSDLLPLSSVAICYILSFVYLAIYWNNHHNMFQAVTGINGKILWANIYLLFWLTLIPFTTAWAGESHFAKLPTALYGFILLMAACAYFFLTHALIIQHGKKSLLAAAIGRDFKGKISMVLYALGVLLSFWHPFVGFLIYISVACMWFIPDSRIEKKLKQDSPS